MNVKSISLIAVILMLSCHIVVAQAKDDNLKNLTEEERKEAFITLKNELDGHYQIQVVNARLKPTISYELLEKIKDNQGSGNNTFHYKENIRVLVLPKNASTKIEKQIIYVND